MSAREFPILRDRRASSTGRRSVPWSWVAPHEAQALRNHGGQTLERLAERGGLSPAELYCAVHGWPLSAMQRRKMTEEQAETWLAAWDGGTGNVSDPDYAALDPGIRETVRRLRAAGFNTTDSGDGVSKLEAGTDIGEALGFAHVVIRCEPDRLVAEARRLLAFLGEHGFCIESVGASSIWIQADYDPTNDIATIMLAGVADRGWL